ncbi:hypothetical protein MNBD_GAMMA10-1620 [hydrothermal vent metagenome]|uniref:Uncharacterized protein n=1 Tax=hydrothermal vent metagenome TaxID=652676 RepID=A0A3B0Y8V4_9ZZZZ
MAKNNHVKTNAVRKHEVSMISWKLYRATKNRKYIRRKNDV